MWNSKQAQNNDLNKTQLKIWQYADLSLKKWGGVETHIRSVSDALHRTGVEVHISKELPPWLNGVNTSTVTILHTHGIATPSLSMLRCYGRWASLVSTAKKNVIWMHVAHGTSIGRLIACGEYFSRSGWLGTARDFVPAQAAASVVAVSEQVRSELKRYFKIKTPIAVISNGVHSNIYNKIDMLSSSRRIAFVGRGTDYVKNLETLIKAAQIAHESCSRVGDNSVAPFELLLIPGDPRFHGLSFIKEFDNTPVGPEAVAAQLRACRAVVLPSFYESDGIVLREAQAMGLYIVASDTPSIRQNLSGYENAVLINPHNVEALAEVLIKASSIVYTPTPRVRDWDAVAQDFLNLYRTQLQSSAL